MKLFFGSAVQPADAFAGNNIEKRSHGASNETGAAERLADWTALLATGLTASTAATALHSARSEPSTNSNEAAIHTPEKPAKRRAVRLQSQCLSTLQQSSDWLQALPSDLVAQSQPLKRVQSVTALLQMPSTRKQRQEMQSLLIDWDVIQKHGRKRPLHELKQELVKKVVKETRRLKNMHNTGTAAMPTAATLPRRVNYSAIQAALLKSTEQQTI